MHAGKHDDSFVFLERAMSIEKRLEENVGNRDERLGELYDLAACIFDDVSRGNCQVMSVLKQVNYEPYRVSKKN